MNFEKAFENYKNGTATDEEKMFVEAEIRKARKINEAIEEMDAKRVVEPADTQDVKKAIDLMKRKSWIRTAVISLIVVLTVAVVAIGSLFIYVNATAAGKAEFTKEECIDAAKHIVAEAIGDPSKEIVLRDVERDIRIEYGKISSAVYFYEIEIVSGYLEYDVVVNSVTGEAVIVDVGD